MTAEEKVRKVYPEAWYSGVSVWRSENYNEDDREYGDLGSTWEKAAEHMSVKGNSPFSLSTSGEGEKTARCMSLAQQIVSLLDDETEQKVAETALRLVLMRSRYEGAAA